MFSDKFLWRDNVIPRWTPPVLFWDEAGNRCAIDVPLNSILVCKPTSSPPTVGIVNVRGVPVEPYFTATYQSTDTETQLPWSKSITFANRPDTAYMLSDDLSFDLLRLRPGAALSLRNELYGPRADGSLFDDFAEFARSHSKISTPK